MNETLLWLVSTLANLASLKSSNTHNVAFINTCAAGNVKEALPQAFTNWCQQNHISFSVSDGINDCGVFDIAVQFRFDSAQPTVVIAKAIGEGLLEVYQRDLEGNNLRTSKVRVAAMSEIFSEEAIYLLNIYGAHQLPPSKGGALKDFWQILMQDKKDILLIYVFAIFGGAINLTLPLGIQAIVSLITMQQMNTSWWLLVFVVLLGLVFTGVTQIFQLSIIETLQQRLFFRAAFTFSNKLPRLNIEKLGEYYPPELVNRFFDVLTIQKGLSKILMDFSTSTLQILFGLLLLSFYHPFFIFFGLLWLVILVAILLLLSPAGLRTSLQESKYKYKLVYWLQEVARNLVTFKLSDSQQYIFQRTDANVTGYLKSRKAHFAILLQQFVFILLFKFVVTGTLLIVGSILVVNQELNIGQFVAAEIIIILLMVSAEKLMMTMETVYDVLTSVEKLKKVTTLQEDQSNANGYSVDEMGAGYSLAAKGLAFRYHDSQKPLLQDVDFIVRAGEKITIKATGGSGKTTLLKLLAGLYTPTEGQVLLNELPLQNFRRDELFTCIGHNLDSGQIFNGTLEHNISLGRTGIGREEVLRICKLCDLMPFIQQLPYGLLTEFSAADRRLSGSFLKRIALARALVHNPSLLILDDTLPEMGLEEQGHLWDYIWDEKANRTVIMVSDSDRIAQQSNRVYMLSNHKLELLKGGLI